MIKLSLSLTVIASIAGFAIGLANSQTKEKIEQQQQLIQQEALKAVLPLNTKIESKTGSGELPETYWIAKKNNQAVAYAFKLAGRGYAANIVFMAGIDISGKVIGINILEQSETPGLGARVNEVVSNKYIWNGLFTPKDASSPWFTDQFKNLDITNAISIDKSLGEWHSLNENSRKSLLSKNSVTAITGSTISTKAVTRALEQDAAKFLKLLSQSEG